MRFTVLVVLAGCHAGGGPVVAVSETGVRLGAEASGGLGPLGATLGGTTGIANESPTRSYITFDPGYMSATRSSEGLDMFVGYGATIGYASHEGPEDHWALGVWAAPLWLDDSCRDGHVVYSVAIGFRYLGGVHEFFASPKLNGALIPCL